MMDVNKNVVEGVICKRLAEEGIDMREAVHQQVPVRGPKTHFRGKESINGIWVSSDLEVTGANYLPFNLDIWDHRPVMVNITMESILGAKIAKIAPVKAHQLNSKIKKIRDYSIENLKRSFKK